MCNFFQSGRSKGNVLLLTFRDLTPDTEYTVTVIGHVAENGKEFASPVGSATGRTSKNFLSRTSLTISRQVSARRQHWEHYGNFHKSNSV